MGNKKAKMNFSIPRILPNSRRGLSTVVTSLIIILLVLVAVGIIWVVVQNIISEGSEQVSLGKFTIDLEIKNVEMVSGEHSNLGNISVVVKRNPGDGELVGIKFVVTGASGVSEVFENMTVIQELGSQLFKLEMSVLNATAGEIETISIAPILETSGGKEFTGNEIDEFEVGELNATLV